MHRRKSQRGFWEARFGFSQFGNSAKWGIGNPANRQIPHSPILFPPILLSYKASIILTGTFFCIVSNRAINLLAIISPAGANPNAFCNTVQVCAS
jgi:hypothetical protein